MMNHGDHQAGGQFARDTLSGLLRNRLIGPGALVAALAVIILTLAARNAVAPRAPATASTLSSNAAKDYNAAEGLRVNQRCDLAIPLYLRAVTKNPMYVNAYNGLGACYQSIGSFDAAIVQYDKAIAIDPTNFGLYMNRAGAEANNGSTGAAAADDTIALQRATPQVPSYVSIANSFASFADFPDAVKALDKAIALVPGDPSLYEQRAGIYMQEHDSGRAFADYQRAIKVAPFIASRATVYADLANVYDQMQNYDSAFGAIATAIRLQPDNAGLYNQSGNIHQDAGAFTAALALYNKALRLAPAGPVAEAAHEARGDVFVKLGQTKAALAEYRRARTLTFDSARLWFLKGKITALLPPPQPQQSHGRKHK